MDSALIPFEQQDLGSGEVPVEVWVNKQERVYSVTNFVQLLRSRGFSVVGLDVGHQMNVQNCRAIEV